MHPGKDRGIFCSKPVVFAFGCREFSRPCKLDGLDIIACVNKGELGFCRYARSNRFSRFKCADRIQKIVCYIDSQLIKRVILMKLIGLVRGRKINTLSFMANPFEQPAKEPDTLWTSRL